MRTSLPIFLLQRLRRSPTVSERSCSLRIRGVGAFRPPAPQRQHSLPERASFQRRLRPSGSQDGRQFPLLGVGRQGVSATQGGVCKGGAVDVRGEDEGSEQEERCSARVDRPSMGTEHLLHSPLSLQLMVKLSKVDDNDPQVDVQKLTATFAVN